MSLILHFVLYTSFFCKLAITAHIDENPNQCTSKCGSFRVPFPFYLNASSCVPKLSDAFSLSCVNSTSLFLNIASESYRVLEFFPDGVLVDFPNTSTCRLYNDLKSFVFSGNEYYGISTDNVVDLYDCEDSSLCKTDCERNNFVIPGCDDVGRHPSCCYPLSDRTAWRPAHSSLSGFSQFGCRGFSSWVILPGTATAKRGVKLEWAVPRNSTYATCAVNADILNATSVAGIRCRCPNGFAGDGFPVGVGCLKSCFKDGKEVRGSDCYQKHHGRKKAIILAGVISSSTLTVVILMAFCLLKRHKRSHRFDISDPVHCQSGMFSQKACRPRLFTYHELEEATKGFQDELKLADNIYAGTHSQYSHIAVQKIECDSEGDLIWILFRLESLYAVSHRNMARIIGWSIDSGYTPLVVYNYPQNGTFKEHLQRARDEHIPFDWYQRLNIAAETAAALAWLQYEISPPIFHHHLESACIFLDMDFSVQLAGFELHNNDDAGFEGPHCSRKNDVYSFGVILLEMITGNTISTTALPKIKKGKLEEIVDPSLYYHEQPALHREQIEVIADLATRCLLFGGDGRMGMADVARELIHITKGTVDGSGRKGPALEETFSNSSLLQMISMSPDSIHLP